MSIKAIWATAILTFLLLGLNSPVTAATCAERVREHCSDKQRSCNATRRVPEYECRRLYRICLESMRQNCLQGPNPRWGLDPEDHSGSGKGTKPPCILWGRRHTGATPCNPATQDCICLRRDYAPVEVR